MSRADVIELAGLIVLAIGAGLLFYGLYLLSTWLMLIVSGVALMAAGGVAVYTANRGGA
jgi:hypothetical protein